LNLRPAFDFNLEVARYWLEEYHIDGYRIDAAAMIDNFEFIQNVRDQCKEIASPKPFLIVAEHIPEKPEIASPDGPADGAWHVSFMRWVTPLLCEHEVEGQPFDVEQVLRTLQPKNDGYVNPLLAVNYLESHDEFTLMQKLAEHGVVEDKALRRNQLGATLLFTAVGIPMLFQGQEFGGFRVRKPEVRPLQWDLLNHAYGRQLHQHYSFLMALRHRSSALQRGDFNVISFQPEKGLFAFARTSSEQQLIVLVNIRDQDCSFDVEFPNGEWKELFFSYSLQVTNGHMTDKINASGTKIYQKIK